MSKIVVANQFEHLFLHAHARRGFLSLTTWETLQISIVARYKFSCLLIKNADLNYNYVIIFPFFYSILSSVFSSPYRYIYRRGHRTAKGRIASLKKARGGKQNRPWLVWLVIQVRMYMLRKSLMTNLSLPQQESSKQRKSSLANS